MIVVFLGPSLSRREARATLDADYRPPARQGDVFRALEDRPRAIVLIDGVFEAAPSVWHHELLAAHAAGIPLFGGVSMGALRAAELPGVVTPVGEIARRFVDGRWNDDALVALLHGDEASGYRALSVPWVNVWATAQAAVRARVLSAARARSLCRAAEAIFYQARTWRAVLEALDWPSPARARLADFVREAAVDLKAADARTVLRHVARAELAVLPPESSRLSSFVRRARLGQIPEAPADEGVRTLLLAELARLARIEAEPARVAWWRGQLAGRAADVLEGWAEALALEEMILSAPERFVADGPSRAEGAALVAAKSAASRRGRTPRRRR
ncbi:MAG: TfuA-like protein [Myxococcota bacterium]